MKNTTNTQKTYHDVELRVYDDKQGLILIINTDEYFEEQQIHPYDISFDTAARIFIDLLNDTSYCKDDADIKVNRQIRDKLISGHYSIDDADETWPAIMIRIESIEA